MIEGKEGMAKKKDFLILFGALIIIGLIVFVFALISAPLLDNPKQTKNYSGLFNFTCFSSLDTAYNATLWIVNATGGTYTFNNISTVTNDSANQSYFHATVDISMLTDGIYNFSCLIRNITDATAEQGYMYSANVTNITIDNTAPNVSYYNILNGDYLNGTLNISAMVNDVARGVVGSVYFNITDSSETQLYFTNSTTLGTGYFNISINVTDFADGVYNITIYANDTALLKSNSSNGTLEAFANLNNSETISITIDDTAPTATYECLPASVTIGQEVVCTCTGSDATAGVNYTNDGTTSTGGSGVVTRITTRSAGTFTRTCTVKDRAGNIIATAASASYTVTSPAGGTTGGTSGTTTPFTTSTTTAATITPTAPATISNFASSSGVTEIKIEVSETANNVQVTVQNYESTAPSAVSTSTTTAYKYLKVDTQNLAGKLSKATMKIQVEKTWVSGQGISKEDVALFKYDLAMSQWNELSTTYVSEDNNYYYYSVELSSFSYFVIATKGAVVSGEEGPTTGEEQPTAAAGLPYWVWIIIGLVVLVVIGGGIALRKKKK